MEPFAFLVCAAVCAIVPPVGGQPREVCVARMEKSLRTDPTTRVICQSLDLPYGEVIDSAGKLKTRSPPWADPSRGWAGR